MHIIFKGEDLGAFAFDDLTMTQLFAIKAATGIDGVVPLAEGLSQLQPGPMQAIVWHMKSQRGDHVPVASIDFAVKDFTFANDDGSKITAEQAAEAATAAQSGNVGGSETSETSISGHSDTSSDTPSQTLTL